MLWGTPMRVASSRRQGAPLFGPGIYRSEGMVEATGTSLGGGGGEIRTLWKASLPNARNTCTIADGAADGRAPLLSGGADAAGSEIRIDESVMKFAVKLPCNLSAGKG